jgi:hypothetical protein
MSRNYIFSPPSATMAYSGTALLFSILPVTVYKISPFLNIKISKTELKIEVVVAYKMQHKEMQAHSYMLLTLITLLSRTFKDLFR